MDILAVLIVLLVIALLADSKENRTVRLDEAEAMAAIMDHPRINGTRLVFIPEKYESAKLIASHNEHRDCQDCFGPAIERMKKRYHKRKTS